MSCIYPKGFLDEITINEVTNLKELTALLIPVFDHGIAKNRTVAFRGLSTLTDSVGLRNIQNELRDGLLLWIYNHCPESIYTSPVIRDAGYKDTFMDHISKYINCAMTVKKEIFGDFLNDRKLYSLIIYIYLKMKKNPFLLLKDPRGYCKCCNKQCKIELKQCERIEELSLPNFPMPTGRSSNQGGIIDKMKENDWEVIELFNRECHSSWLGLATPNGCSARGALSKAARSNGENRIIKIDPITQSKIIIIGDNEFILKVKYIINGYIDQFEVLVELTKEWVIVDTGTPIPPPVTDPVSLPQTNRAQLEDQPLVIEALPIEEIPKYVVFMDLIKSGRIYISVKNTETNIKYERYLTNTCDFWESNKHYFQNNFRNLFVILDQVFIKMKSDIQWCISRELNDIIHLTLKKEDIMGFEIIIEIEKKEDNISILQKQNKILEERVSELERVIKLYLIGSTSTSGWEYMKEKLDIKF